MEEPKIPSKPAALKLTPEAIKIIRAALAMQARGLKGRRLRNASLRVRGKEPAPGLYAGVKRHARYLKRTISTLAAEPHVHPRHLRPAA